MIGQMLFLGDFFIIATLVVKGFISIIKRFVKAIFILAIAFACLRILNFI
jgi:hypothetical protein